MTESFPMCLPSCSQQNRVVRRAACAASHVLPLYPLPSLWCLFPVRLLLSLLFLFLICFPAVLGAQDKPAFTIEDECTAFAFAPDGRLAYAVRHIFTVRRYEMQRDDIWVATLDGKRKRIVNGEKLVQGRTPFSYAIQSLRWSPDGTRLTVDMLTSALVDEKGNTQEGSVSLLLDENGKEIKIQGGDSVIPEGWQAVWLGDGVTVAFLAEAVKPRLLFSINTVRPVAGRGGRLFNRSAFAAVAWEARRSAAVAVERDAKLSGPPGLVELDLLKETLRELATLDGYLGKLSLSPSGTKIAYFRDNETLEVRDRALPDHVSRVRTTFGSFAWAPDERRILLKRGQDRRSGDLVWIRLADGKAEPALHGLSFRDFALSPDGRWLAVTEPGNRNLLVYPVE